MPDRSPGDAGIVLILAPNERDGLGLSRLLDSEGIGNQRVESLPALAGAIGEATGLVLVTDELLFHADLGPLTERLSRQPPWSDLPFIVLSQMGTLARRQLDEIRLADRLGNVLFIERPLNAITLVSAVKTSLRARSWQRRLRGHMEAEAAEAERMAELLEERVRQRTAALEAAEAERRRIAAALAQSQKMEAVGQLTGGIAHDFNNMLTGVLGSLDLMQARLAKGRFSELERFLGLARTGAERAAALTQRLLAFSRRQVLTPQPVELQRLVAGMEELIRSTIGPEITIEVTAPAESWPVLCDPHQMESALLNLCINARDAMPGGGRLGIAVDNLPGSDEAGGDQVMLSVRDTGSGMTPEVMRRAFDPFFTTKPIGQGTGLGLSMIYGFVQQSGGHVTIDSAPGQGTTLRLLFPRHRGDIPAAAEAGRPGATDAGPGGTVLVVDDEPSLRLLAAEVLRERGYGVLDAADAASALEILRSGVAIDLLVTDIGMPGGMNGRDLALAARELRGRLRVLFITGYPEAALEGVALSDMDTQLLTKPFTMELLAERIRHMMAKE
ncbi:ATP-binding protein [Roseomonas gilardii subsp. gilardii]|uniref:ATP-binding protein n=1 Tax=Roseomonas gilardii TaxID=257708 RepID=UPI001FF9EAE3|nr:ATP-binding protein [Roseomonas gilardii]UPG71057.1 ATP-binding protein [Roseomonas gilardii subsp. gilardii]